MSSSSCLASVCASLVTDFKRLYSSLCLFESSCPFCLLCIFGRRLGSRNRQPVGIVRMMFYDSGALILTSEKGSAWVLPTASVVQAHSFTGIPRVDHGDVSGLFSVWEVIPTEEQLRGVDCVEVRNYPFSLTSSVVVNLQRYNIVNARLSTTFLQLIDFEFQQMQYPLFWQKILWNFVVFSGRFVTLVLQSGKHSHRHRRLCWIRVRVEDPLHTSVQGLWHTLHQKHGKTSASLELSNTMSTALPFYYGN